MSVQRPETGRSGGRAGIFREEALRHHSVGREEGDVLRLPPGWTRWTYWLLLAAFAVGLGFVTLGTVREDVRGPAVIRLEGRARLEAFLPGSSRPLLRRGMTVHVELAGYPDVHPQATVDEVSDRLVGSSEAQRLLGPAIADAVDLPAGPLVFVRASFAGEAFRSGGEEHRYLEGMPAKVEVAVKSERILFALLPGLRSALAD